MKRTFFYPPLVVLVLICCTNSAQVQNQITDDSYLDVVTLEGNSYEIGLQHGTILKIKIHNLITLWKGDLIDTYSMNPDTFISRFARETDFLSSIQQHTPDLWDEVQGIAEGADVDLQTLYVFQLIDEIWSMGNQVQNHHCTTFGVDKTDSHPVLSGQNLDIPFYHGYQTLLHIKDTVKNIESFVFTFPGLIGANGLNNRTVSVNVNTLLQLAPSKTGLPVDFVVRSILERATYSEAVQFIKSINHAAGQNYIIADKDSVGSFECSEIFAKRFFPFLNARFTYHTNHPLINFNLRDEILNQLVYNDLSAEDYTTYCYRFESLKSLFPNNSVAIDVRTLKSLFASRGTNINNQSTFGCTIMIHSDPPELHIAPGRPDEVLFQVFRF